VIASEIEYGRDALHQVFESYALIAKGVIDSDPRDTAMLTEINGFLDEFLRHWTPEHNSPQEWELEFYEQRTDIDRHRLLELRRQAAANRKLVRVKEELETWRSVQRFGLLWWTQRRLRETGDDAYVGAWNAFVGYFSDIQRTARTVDRAIQADFEDRGRWVQWVPMGPLHGGAFAGPAIDLEFLQTFIIVALNFISPEGPRPQFEPLEWLSGRMTEIEQTIEGVVANERLRALIPEEAVEERAARLTEAFQSMARAREEQEEQRVIDSPLAESAVEHFEARIRDAWATHRLLAAALQREGMYEVVEGEAEADFPEWGLRSWMPKNWLIADPRVGGLDVHAEQLGRELGESEAKLIVGVAAAVPEFVGAPDQSLAQTLRRAIAELREHGHHPVVLVPYHWRWQEILELTLSERRGGPAPTPGWLPVELWDRFVGTADDVAVVLEGGLPEERMLVIVLDTFARWRQWRRPGEHEVMISITAYDEDEARRLVAENRDLFRDESRTTDEARARELRKHVLLDVHERVKIDVIDGEAAYWLQVPDQLRER
jgi:hypothetical protein